MIKNYYTRVNFLLTMMPPVHAGLLSRWSLLILPTAAAINLLINVFDTLSNGK